MRMRPTHITVVLTAAVVAAMLAIPAHAAAMASIDFRAPSTVTTEPSDLTTVAAGASGRMVAVWAQGGNADGIYVSDLAFGSWTPGVKIPGSEDGERPVVAMSPKGHVVVAWQVEHGHAKSGAVGVSTRAPSKDFATATFLGSIAGGADNTDPAVAINDAGRSVVAWTHAGSSARSVEAVIGAASAFSPVRSVESSASAPSVAVDKAGNVIMIYARAETSVQQALVAAGSTTFGTPATLDPLATGENNIDFNARVRSNQAGQVVAGWGEPCDESETCTNVFANRMGIGTTTTGITATHRVSNPHADADPLLGPGRKAGGWTEVAIDDAGNRSMAWDVVAETTGWEYWSTHVAPDGTRSPASLIASNTTAVDGELKLVAAAGHVVAAWVRADDAGEPSRILMSQVAFPASGAASAWPAAVTVSASGTSADHVGIGLSANGVAGAAWRSGDAIHAATNAPADRTKPVMTLPAQGTTFGMTTAGVVLMRVRCPATEGACIGAVTPRMRTQVGRTVSLAPAGAVASFSMRGARWATVKVVLNRAARSAVATHGKLDLTVTFDVRDAAGNRSVVTRRYAAKSAT